MPFKTGQPNPGFQPGQSGNPFGRPKGSKNRLAEDFIAAMHEDFKLHGAEAVMKVRNERPHEYLKVIASILPKELHVTDATLGDMSDDQLIEFLASIRSLTVADHGKAIAGRAKQEAGEEGAEPARRAN